MAPLLASCGNTVNSSPYVVDPNGLILPDCTDGQLIGVNPDKTLFCVSAVSGMLNPPVCNDNTQALTSMKDAVSGKNTLSCVNKGSGVNDATTTTRIMNAQTSVTNLQMNVNLLTTGGGARAKYVGATVAKPADATFASGVFKSVAAANKLCEAAGFGTGSHMCTPFEIYESVIVGNILDGTADVGPLLIFMEAWVPPFALAGASEASSGQSENCGSYTYGTGDRKWRTTNFRFAVPSTGGTVRVPQFNAQGCNLGSALSIACCK